MTDTADPKPPWWATKSKAEGRKPGADSAKASALAVANQRSTSQYRQGVERREKMLAALATGMGVQEACAHIGIAVMTHRKWRSKYPEYATRVDAVRITAAQANTGPESVRGQTRTLAFGNFRRDILDMDSPWFHLQAVKWIEEAPAGSVTLMLWPPEHGKTSLLEDYCTWKLAMDPNHRIGVGSGSRSHSMKVLRRIQNRFEDESPFPKLIARYGPFAPQTGLGNRKAIQPWAATHFDVFMRRTHDERDYSMTALGIGSNVVGSRMDTLLLDDLQSIKTLAQTKAIVETVRQDWLSRPGSKGRTFIVGTRVGEEDVYSELIESGILTKVLLFRAHDSDGVWLWPERYSPEEYEIMKRNAGTAAWERNYMQRATVKGEQTFTEEMTAAALNPMRAIFHDPPTNAPGVVLGLDPGFGINVVLAAAATERKLIILGGREDVGLTSNQQIFDVVHETAIAHTTPDVPWLHLVIEDKAFQKGLLQDDALLSMRQRYGFTVHGHQTGINKYDPNLGVAAMARSFLREEIEIPGADDPATKRFREALLAELHKWRPNMRGTRLKQDYVMALWFIWIWWRSHKETLATAGAGDFNFGGLPFAMTGSGLALPTGPYGRTA